ncbi:hypothetical protein Tsp_09842 [Trichinella spiralis]|uniref:hypothetical protein n=1 Tax=Trichinella spiralis TaxID=6334 RepID=UPI0001EFDA09|nr:hypothetical protein Tsp_09842 [Trichinella spiralis]
MNVHIRASRFSHVSSRQGTQLRHSRIMHLLSSGELIHSGDVCKNDETANHPQLPYSKLLLVTRNSSAMNCLKFIPDEIDTLWEECHQSIAVLQEYHRRRFCL